MNFYVYEHWRPDTKLPFYVGKGTGSRSRVFLQRGKVYDSVRQSLQHGGLKIISRILVSGLTEREAFDLETKRIAYLRAQNVALLNRTNGGDGTWGLKYTEERRLKLSVSLRGRIRTQEQRERISIGQKNKGPVSDQTRQRLSDAGKNRRFSEEHKNNIRSALLGKPKSEEHRANLAIARKDVIQTPRSPEARARMSAAQKKRVLPPEVWAKIRAAVSKAQKGRIPSEESRQKMSSSQSGRKHSEETKLKMRVKAFEREARKRSLAEQSSAVI